LAGSETGVIIEVEGIPIELHVRGAGRPLLVVHGWSADHRYLCADLDPVFDAHGGWRRVAFDLPGHGATMAPDWLGTQEQMLRIVAAVGEGAFGTEPYAVAGNSYGGYLALGLVRTAPERLLGAALLVPDLPRDDTTREVADPVVIHPDPAAFDALADDEAWIPDALPVHERRMLEAIRAHDMPAYRICDRACLERLNAAYVHTGAAADGSRPFGRPSLVVAGRQDGTVGWRRQMGLQDEFPRGTFATLDLGGHHLGRVERPALFAALVDDWLARMEREAA
jgi:pimeloyl-ACP methyl ester carboxylesterase